MSGVKRYSALKTSITLRQPYASPNTVELVLASDYDQLHDANQRLEGEVERLTAAAKPDAELVRQCIAQELATWEGDFKGPVHTAMRCLQVRIDAKMATLK